MLENAGKFATSIPIYTKPSWMTDSDWQVVSDTASKYGIPPYLLVAIGKHETGWGSLGVGRNYLMGYGVPDSGSLQSQYSGFQSQLEATAQKMQRWVTKSGGLSLETLQTMNNRTTNPSDFYATDSNWPNAVWKIYTELGGGKTTGGGKGNGGSDGISGSNKTTFESFLGLRFVDVIIIIIGLILIIFGILKLTKGVPA